MSDYVAHQTATPAASASETNIASPVPPTPSSSSSRTARQRPRSSSSWGDGRVLNSNPVQENADDFRLNRDSPANGHMALETNVADASIIDRASAENEMVSSALPLLGQAVDCASQYTLGADRGVSHIRASSLPDLHHIDPVSPAIPAAAPINGMVVGHSPFIDVVKDQEITPWPPSDPDEAALLAYFCTNLASWVCTKCITLFDVSS